MSSSTFEPGHIIAGRYRVEHLLGQGAMGSVYRALQLSVGRSVALKLIVDEHTGDPAHVERFQREALALSRLAHPNTVRLFDFGTSERGWPFIVMELLRGADLADDLERHGPLRWDQALCLLRGVASSLAEAHAMGIVHRDIKPANIFLCADAAWPSVKVLDFGIAGHTERGAAPRLTLTGTVVGSAAYMSPEQAQGKTVGPASDLYGLGVVLFEALTGRTPFHGRSFTAQLLAKVLEPAPRLGELAPEPDVPAEVAALVEQLLEREPSRRPASAVTLIARIDELLARASLPPVERAVLPPSARLPAAGIAKTEPMLVARTIDEAWSPPRAEDIASIRRRPGSRRSRWALAAAAAGVLGLALGWAQSTLAPVLEAATAPAPKKTTSTTASRSIASSTSLVSATRSAIPAKVEVSALGNSRDEALPDLTDSAEWVRFEVPPLEPEAAPRHRQGGSEDGASSGERAEEVSSSPAVPRPSRAPGARKRHRPPVALPEPEAALEPAAPSTTAGAPPSAAAPALPEPVAVAAPPEARTVLLPGAPPSAAASAPQAQPAAVASPGARTVLLPESLPLPAPARAASSESAPPSAAERSWARRYPNVMAVRAALASGEITPLQRNRIVARLRERRYEARALAARDYQAGWISRHELRARQRAIDREYEGY